MSAFQPNTFQPNAFQEGAATASSTSYIGRDPFVVPRPAMPSSTVALLTFTVNLLLTTLVGSAPAAVPFTLDRTTQLDSVCPRIGYQQVQQAPNLLLTTLAFPVGAESSESISRFRAVQQPNDPLNLLTTTLAVAAPAESPFAQDEWPNPVRSIQTREYGFTQSQVFNTANVVFSAPFNQSNWQNPLRVIPRAQIPLLHRYAGEPVAAVDPTKPFLQVDWTNPVRLILSREYGFVQSQIFNTADVPTIKPFLQTEWPNPRVNPTYRQFQNNGRVLGEEPLPFSQTEWPNPLPKPLARQGLTSSQIFGAADVVNIKPFLQPEWPNPVLAIKTREFGLVQSQVFNTADPPNPFLQTNWPNPVRPILSREYGFVQSQVFNTADVIVLTRLYRRSIRGNDATGLDDWTISYQV